MHHIKQHYYTRRAILSALMLLLLPCLATTVYAWERADRLALMAADLLPVVLSARQADTGTTPDAIIGNNTDNTAANATNTTIFILYQKKRHLAEKVKQRFTELNSTDSMNFVAVPMSARQFSRQFANDIADNKHPPEISGRTIKPGDVAFIIDELHEQLAHVLRVAHANRVMSYSSRIKDLPKGVAVGLSVTERVLPAVNPEVLQTQKTQFSPLFMRIAREVQ